MNCIHPPSLTLPRCRYMGSAWLSRAASWCYRPVATDQPVEKQKIRLLYNFFAIRDSFPSLERTNKLLYGWLSAVFTSCTAIGELEQFLIAKKLQTRPLFCFWVPEVAARKLRGGVAARLRFD